MDLFTIRCVVSVNIRMPMMGSTTPPWLRDWASLLLTKEERKSVIHSRHQVNADYHYDKDGNNFWL
jgi:hypothetical protein